MNPKDECVKFALDCRKVCYYFPIEQANSRYTHQLLYKLGSLPFGNSCCYIARRRNNTILHAASYAFYTLTILSLKTHTHTILSTIQQVLPRVTQPFHRYRCFAIINFSGGCFGRRLVRWQMLCRHLVCWRMLYRCLVR